MTATLTDMRLELVATGELMRLFARSRARIVQYAAAPDFPEPVAELSMGRIWYLSEVLDWAKAHNRELHSLADNPPPGRGRHTTPPPPAD